MVLNQRFKIYCEQGALLANSSAHIGENLVGGKRIAYVDSILVHGTTTDVGIEASAARKDYVYIHTPEATYAQEVKIIIKYYV